MSPRIFLNKSLMSDEQQQTFHFNWLNGREGYQYKYFHDETYRYNVLAKGRRSGGTQGAMLYLIKWLLSDNNRKALWVDTTQDNLARYIERYAFPQLAQLQTSVWNWHVQKKLLTFKNGSYADFRSSERPENIEGFAYGLIILNEAGIILADRNLWQQSIRPMIMDYQARVFAIGTPKGKRDKTGNDHLFYEMWKWGSTEQMDHPHWHAVNWTSYDNPKLIKSEIDAMAAEIPESLRQQEIFGRFIDIAAESLCKESWFKYQDNQPDWLGPNIMRRVLSLDTAYKKADTNDYSAGIEVLQTWDGQWLITDAWEERLAYPELQAKIKLLFEARHYDLIVVEDAASGQSLIQSMQRTPVPVVPYKSDKDKIARFVSITPLIESGKVHLVKDSWNKMLVGRCVMFPQVEFDDIIDAFSQALDYCRAPMDLGENGRRVVSRKFVPMSDNLVGY